MVCYSIAVNWPCHKEGHRHTLAGRSPRGLHLWSSWSSSRRSLDASGRMSKRRQKVGGKAHHVKKRALSTRQHDSTTSPDITSSPRPISSDAITARRRRLRLTGLLSGTPLLEQKSAATMTTAIDACVIRQYLQRADPTSTLLHWRSRTT
jgi:hypothetical protein